jgi:hypothetical protein
MGLDMYLYATRFIWHNDKQLQSTINVAVPCPFSNNPKYIKYEVLYWRKANAIHRWFVENVQDNQDDCGEYYVTRENLRDLRDLCKTIIGIACLIPGKISNGEILKNGEFVPNLIDGMTIKNAEQIASLLPTQSGFFYGNTDYDSYYLKEIIRTKEVLDKVLEIEDSAWTFEYHSSW